MRRTSMQCASYRIIRDPFDRMILAQAKVKASTIVTADRAFALYDIAAIWV
jgi:PIN domain nuclease of toxin-antitoxin system